MDTTYAISDTDLLLLSMEFRISIVIFYHARQRFNLKVGHFDGEKMMRNVLHIVLSAVLGCCLTTGYALGNDRPLVYASNYPLYFFATEIAGGEVDVRLPEMTGDPAYWAPDGDQVAALLATFC